MSGPFPTQRVAPSAHALTLFRVLPDGVTPRTYTATTFPRNPRQGCEQFIRMCRKVGWLRDPGEGSYAVLDVLDENGSIVQDFAVPDARAFQRIKRKLNLRVGPGDDA